METLFKKVHSKCLKLKVFFFQREKQQAMMDEILFAIKL